MDQSIQSSLYLSGASENTDMLVLVVGTAKEGCCLSKARLQCAATNIGAGNGEWRATPFSHAYKQMCNLIIFLKGRKSHTMASPVSSFAAGEPVPHNL